MLLAWYPVVAFLLCMLCAQLGVAVAAWPWHRLTHGSWVEKARRAYPVRVACRGAYLLPILSALSLFYADHDPGMRLRESLLQIAGLTWFAGYVAAVLVASRTERRILGFPKRMPGFLRRWIAYRIALKPFWVVAVVMALLMPASMTPQVGILLLVTILALYRCMAGDGLRIGRRLGLVRSASPKLDVVIQRIAERMKTQEILAYELPSLHAMAFAWPTISSVIVTDRALDILSDEELEAVCAHEAAHLMEPEHIQAMRSASVVFLLPLVATKPLICSLGVGVYLVLLLALLALGRSARGWSRRLEQRADAIAQTYEPEAGAYARALARLYQANLTPVVLPGAGSTHPHLYDRLVAAGVQPDYPRPKPPSRIRGAIAVLFSLTLVMLGLLAFLML